MRRRGDSGANSARRRLAEAAAAFDAEQQGDMTHEALHGAFDAEPDPAADTVVDGRSAVSGWEPPVPLSSLPDAVPFPLDTLPLPIRQYVEELAWATNTPPDFAALPVLAVAAAAVGNARRLAITRTHRQSLSLWCAVVGRPGSGKSTPLELAKEPLLIAERRYRRQWERDMDEWEAGNPDHRGEKPRMRRCLLNDATGEAVIRALGDNPRGLLMARDELAGLVTGMDQYKEGGKGNERQNYLSIWGGASISLDRIRLEGVPLMVRRPFLCIAGTIQPQVVERLAGGSDSGPAPDDGFMDRFLIAYPQELPAIGEQWREVSADSADAWASTVDRLLLLDMGQDSEGDLFPLDVWLSPSGREAWSRLTHEHADEVNGVDFPDHLRGPWAKLVPGYAGRLALLLHLLQDDGGEIEGESVEKAFRLIAYFKAHAQRVRAAMGCDMRVADARRVLAWIERRGSLESFSRRDVHKALACSFDRPELLDAPLNRLVEHGYLMPAIEDKNAPRGPGRKASQRYLVNPLSIGRKMDKMDRMPP